MSLYLSYIRSVIDSVPVLPACCLVKRSNYTCRVAGNNAMALRKRFGNHCTCANRSKIAKFYAGQDDGIHAQPAKSADANGRICCKQIIIYNIMVCGDDTNTRTNIRVIADFNTIGSVNKIVWRIARKNMFAPPDALRKINGRSKVNSPAYLPALAQEMFVKKPRRIKVERHLFAHAEKFLKNPFYHICKSNNN